MRVVVALADAGPQDLVGGGDAGEFGEALVLAVLRALRVPIDIIVGTSVGALGVMYAAGLSIDALDRFFRATQLKRIASSDPLRAGLIGPRKREALAVELLGERTFADLPIRCAVVTVDLVSGREVVLDSGPLVPAMLATAAPVTPAPAVREALLAAVAAPLRLDGGLVNNMPVDVAERLGAQRVIAVQLAEQLPPFHLAAPRHGVWKHLQSPQHLAILSRAIAILRAQTNERLACHVPTLILRPELRGLSLLDMALWDAAAKLEGKPLWRLLGGYGRPLQAYAEAGGTHVPDLRPFLARLLPRLRTVLWLVGWSPRLRHSREARRLRTVLDGMTAFVADRPAG